MKTRVYVSYAAQHSREIADISRFIADLQTRIDQLATDSSFSIEFPGDTLQQRAQFHQAKHTDNQAPIQTLDCAVFLALYSEAYFYDHECLQAWSWFYERKRWHIRRSGQESTALVGIAWSVSHASLPAVVLDGEPLLGAPWPASTETTENLTLSGVSETPISSPMVPLVRIGDELYRDAVAAVARRIIAASDSQPPPMEDIDARHIRIHPDLVVAAASVGVVVAAAPRQAQPEARTNREFYGTQSGDWAPFRPERIDTAFDLAKAALQANAIGGAVCYPAGEHLLANLSKARTEGQVVVVLVDPWLVDSQPFQDVLSRLADHVVGNAAVAGTFAVLNVNDHETQRNAMQLRLNIRKVFTSERNGATASIEMIGDADQLAAELVSAVVRVRRFQNFPSRPSEISAHGFPSLAGPSEETWVDGLIWSGEPVLPRYGGNSGDRR